VRRLVNFVHRSCAISFKPVRSRYNSKLEELKQSFRRVLRRKLTAREEQLLELSESMLAADPDDLPGPEQKPRGTEAA
jgi:hypothetical protein